MESTLRFKITSNQQTIFRGAGLSSFSYGTSICSKFQVPSSARKPSRFLTLELKLGQTSKDSNSGNRSNFPPCTTRCSTIHHVFGNTKAGVISELPSLSTGSSRVNGSSSREASGHVELHDKPKQCMGRRHIISAAAALLTFSISARQKAWSLEAEPGIPATSELVQPEFESKIYRESFAPVDFRSPNESRVENSVTESDTVQAFVQDLQPGASLANPAAMLTAASSGVVIASAGMAGLHQPAAILASNDPSLGLSSRLTGALARGISHFGGGGVAGAVGATLVHPMDTIKTRMQSQSQEDSKHRNYSNELDCAMHIVQEGGIGALYSGLMPQLVGVAPEKAIKLTVNELLLELLETFMPGTRIWALEIIAGGGGGFSQVVFTNPAEIVKVRLQTQSKDGEPKSMWQVVKELGFRGLYNGSLVTMARDIPSSAMFFAAYAFLQKAFPGHGFEAGCLAAIPASYLVTPMDVVKTRLQMETAPGEEPYRGPVDCFRRLLRDEGPSSLFKGSAARVMRYSPQFGVTLVIYNSLCQ